MKPLILILSVLCSGAFAQEAKLTRVQKLELAYQTGLKAHKEGDYEKAEKYLKAVVKASPTNVEALYALESVRTAKLTLVKTASIKTITGFNIPKVEFFELPFNDAIEDYRLLVDLANGEAGPPNIVINDKSSALKKAVLNLKLQNVSSEALLNYILSASKSAAIYKDSYIEIYKP